MINIIDFMENMAYYYYYSTFDYIIRIITIYLFIMIIPNYYKYMYNFLISNYYAIALEIIIYLCLINGKMSFDFFKRKSQLLSYIFPFFYDHIL